MAAAHSAYGIQLAYTNMSDFAALQAGVVQGAVQSLLECKQKARAIESVCESLLPLADSARAKELLEMAREMSSKLAFTFSRLYDTNAKEAFAAAPPTSSNLASGKADSGAAVEAKGAT